MTSAKIARISSIGACAVFMYTAAIIGICHIVHVAANPNGRTVTLPQGRIKGRLSETRNGSFFMEYYGIPYAEPPNRFKVSRWPPPKWNDTKEGSHRPPPCFQMKGKHKIGDEGKTVALAFYNSLTERR